jgi:hypothetical protein
MLGFEVNQVFNDGWDKWVEQTSAANLFTIWSPHSGRWYDHEDKPKGTDGKGTTPAGKALEQRLAEIESLYNAGRIDAITRLQLRSEALRDYEKQVGTSLP